MPFTEKVKWCGISLPETRTLNLHSATFPVLSEAKYRMLCSPAENVSPGCFPYWVMLVMKPELSVASGSDHMTCADFVPLSAVATIFDGQSENTGAETSINEKDISFTTGEKS